MKQGECWSASDQPLGRRFTKIRALVTDAGGALSTPSSREFGIPAVVGTMHATSAQTGGKPVFFFFFFHGTTGW